MVHFSYPAPGSVSLHIHSLEGRNCRLLIGCRAFSAKWIYKLQHQLRQMSPGGEVVKIAMEDWQSNTMTSFSTGKDRLGEAKQCIEDSVRVQKLLMIWPWISSEFSPHKGKLLRWCLWLQQLVETSGSISNTKSLEEKTARHLSWKSTSKLCKGAAVSINSY